MNKKTSEPDMSAMLFVCTRCGARVKAFETLCGACFTYLQTAFYHQRRRHCALADEADEDGGWARVVRLYEDR